MQIPLFDELWWDDGLYHSQPVLDGTLVPQLQTPVSSRYLSIAAEHCAAITVSS